MHYDFWMVVKNPIIFPAIFSWMMAQGLKPFTHYFSTKEWKWSTLFQDGGMPSAHSAFICCIATGVGIHEGFDSLLFALALAFAIIITHDAMGVRRETGVQARVINQLMQDMFSEQYIDFSKLKEMIGHEPSEVLTGSILGIAIAVIGSFLMV